MRINELRARGIPAILFRLDQNQWNTLQVLIIKGENLILWKIFRRESISSTFQSSATVYHGIKLI